jgi:predicted N-acetyltransferase YhbS
LDFQRLDSVSQAQVEDLFESVFTDSEGPEEGRMIGALARDLMARTPPNDFQGFVATDAGRPVGAIFFTRLTFDDDIDAFILAPVAVETGHQGRGIGQGLIRHGLEALRQHGVRVAVTYGDPAFYSKVGFRPVSVDRITPPFALSQPEGWLAQSLDDTPLESMTLGTCDCVAALRDPAYW